MQLIPRMQGWFNIQISVNANHHINKTKEKKQINISIDAGEKKFQHRFMIKTLGKHGTKWQSLHLIKGIYEKTLQLTSYFVARDWMFPPPRSRTRLSPPLLSIVLGVVMSADQRNDQHDQDKKRNKRHTDWKIRNEVTFLFFFFFRLHTWHT